MTRNLEEWDEQGVGGMTGFGKRVGGRQLEGSYRLVLRGRPGRLARHRRRRHRAEVKAMGRAHSARCLRAGGHGRAPAAVL